jgi:hypothetical protein
VGWVSGEKVRKRPNKAVEIKRTAEKIGRIGPVILDPAVSLVNT